MKPTGFQGDHFSLEGALELFKKAESPEEFEKLINTQNSHVNNLDLNEDGETDYIKVLEKQDGDVRAFVLQASLSENENQDIAVIEVEKSGDQKATLQIVGDADIYGKEIILEPSDNKLADADSEFYSYPADPPRNPVTIVNVWGWPCIQHTYRYTYNPWVSPWRWRSYPVWWSPWRPLSWTYWRPYRYSRQYPSYRIVSSRRIVKAHNLYSPNKAPAVTQRKRNQEPNTRSGNTRKNSETNRIRTNQNPERTRPVQKPPNNNKSQNQTIRKSRRGGG